VAPVLLLGGQILLISDPKKWVKFWQILDFWCKVSLTFDSLFEKIS
jgi:hypothetical protein